MRLLVVVPVVVPLVEPFAGLLSEELLPFPPQPDIAAAAAATARAVSMAVGNVCFLMGWALLVARQSRPAPYQGELPCLTQLAPR